MMNIYKQKSQKLVIYIHGKGGTASESEHYAPLFPDCHIIGFDYRSETPQEAAEEFPALFDAVAASYDSVYLVAGSIGAFFSLCSLAKKTIQKAYFISPIVNMEKLIADMMTWAGVSEAELLNKKKIPTSFGETLSWEYLEWVRQHPIFWNTPTEILYGEKDPMQSLETVTNFAQKCSADVNVTIMTGGEHWFHTEEQMSFLDEWLRRNYEA